jgi:hypothetical protein
MHAGEQTANRKRRQALVLVHCQMVEMLDQLLPVAFFSLIDLLSLLLRVRFAAR